MIIDQVTKLLVKGISLPIFNINLEGMRYGQSFDVLGTFLQITFVENPGMAFGIDLGSSTKFFLTLFSLAASLGITYYMYRVRDEKFILRLALALILAGAIGNFIDRAFYGVIYGYAPLFFGKVVDFINVDFFDFSILGRTYDRWPIFNVADSAVTIGVVLLIFFSDHHSDKSKTDDHLKEIESDLPEETNETKKIPLEVTEPETEFNDKTNLEDGENNNGEKT